MHLGAAGYASAASNDCQVIRAIRLLTLTMLLQTVSLLPFAGAGSISSTDWQGRSERGVLSGAFQNGAL